MPFPTKPVRPNRTDAPAWLLGLLLLAFIATGSLAARAVIIENFESGTPTLESADPVQDSDPTAWNVTSGESYGGSGHSLRLYGNTWKAEPITPYPVTVGMVWQCAALVTAIGEMQAFGVTDGTNLLYYTFEGTQLPVTDPWSVVYQGAFPEEEWNLFLLPIAQDWVDRYGYLPTITKLIYVNDRDAGNTGTIYFDEIADVTADLPQAPAVQIVHGRQSVEKLSKSLYRVTIQFGSQVYDPDSPLESLTYHWDFGDGATSAATAPQHEFLVQADYPFTVTLSVRDPEGMWGRDTTRVTVEPGPPDLPVTLSFVGDVMLARGYDNPNGLIDTYGPEHMFEPTLPYLGGATDLAFCNLECPFTDEGDPHPTKSVVFRARPENIAGIAYAGFDWVSLGNNHIIDYGQRGMEETLEMLDGVGIPYAGAGDDDYLALQPSFLNPQGIALGILGQCNRTGREYNYQPFLDAGYNKPGFAWFTEPNLDRAISSTKALADLTIVQSHSGIEYTTGPGMLAGSGWPLEGTDLPPRSNSVYAAQPWPIDLDDPIFRPQGEPAYDGVGPVGGPFGDEEGDPTPPESRADDFLFPTRPSLTDRQLRWHAVDEGADLVINHHPHVLQGFEVYNGVLITHSLGNFVFDQGYAETYPSVIMYTEFDQDRFRSFSFRPAFVDDWVPHVVSGRLGREILDRQAEYSRELGTTVTVDPATMIGTIHRYPGDLVWTPETYERTEALVSDGDGHWVTPPIQRDGDGTLRRILSTSGTGTVEVRLGRELAWHGDFEDEGATFWNLNSSYEGYDATVAHQGQRSLRLRRSGGTSGVSTNLQGYPALLGGLDYSLAVWIRTQNANDANYAATLYTGRGSGSVGTFEVTSPIDGTQDWTRYWRDFSVSDNTPWFFNVSASMGTASGGEATAWFDEARLVAWDAWQPITGPLDVPFPSNYRFLQFRVGEAATSIDVSWEEVSGQEIPSATPEDDPASIGATDRLRLGAPAPNPFRSVAGIEYRLARSGPVRLEIYDVSGRKLATLVDGVLPAGVHRATWAAGDAPNGLYLVRAEADGVVRTQKLLRLR